jgi:hypothetical protein
LLNLFTIDTIATITELRRSARVPRVCSLGSVARTAATFLEPLFFRNVRLFAAERKTAMAVLLCEANVDAAETKTTETLLLLCASAGGRPCNHIVATCESPERWRVSVRAAFAVDGIS